MRYWRIEGFDGLEKIYQEDLRCGLITENQLQSLLKALVANASLNYSEIVGAYVRKNTKRANELLLVTYYKPEPKYSCGENPFFTARVVDLD